MMGSLTSLAAWARRRRLLDLRGGRAARQGGGSHDNFLNLLYTPSHRRRRPLVPRPCACCGPPGASRAPAGLFALLVLSLCVFVCRAWLVSWSHSGGGPLLRTVVRVRLFNTACKARCVSGKGRGGGWVGVWTTPPIRRGAAEESRLSNWQEKTSNNNPRRDRTNYFDSYK